MVNVYTSHLAFMFITFLVIDSVPRLRWSFLAYVASIGLGSLYCIWEWQKSMAIYGIGYRPGYVTGDANYFTASAIIGLLLGIGFLSKRNNRLERWFAAGCIVVSAIAIMLTASRGGFLGLVGAFLFLVFRSQHRIRNLFVVLLFAAVAFTVAPQSPLKRLLNPASDDVSAARSRLTTWDLGLRMIRENPLTGIGLGNFKVAEKAYGSDETHIAHNTYIEVGAEMGLPALLVFLALMVSAWISLERSRREARRLQIPFLYYAINSLQAGMFGFGIAIFFLSAEFVKVLWFSIFIAAALPQVLAACKARAKMPDSTTSREEVASGSGLMFPGRDITSA
jgi:O-antigen ligase